jgi:hypothetical protein
MTLDDLLTLFEDRDIPYDFIETFNNAHVFHIYLTEED